MKYPKTTNANARAYVLGCEPFNGAKNDYSHNGYSVSGRMEGYLYVVYSYGYWPMYVCDTRHPGGLWFANAHRYSATTSKQQGQTYPAGKDCQPLPTGELDAMIANARAWRTPEAKAAFV